MAMDRDANCAVQRTTELELDRKAARLEGIPRKLTIYELFVTPILSFSNRPIVEEMPCVAAWSLHRTAGEMCRFINWPLRPHARCNANAQKVGERDTFLHFS
uniref:Uncharacterized protein n=1 Tax=Oryza sativa subsp. japonica TaxID=39947 RepID=Q94HF7_ORYSJ|nr:Hypothetical protein [Oryza sativa Japonica Group]